MEIQTRSDHINGKYSGLHFFKTIQEAVDASNQDKNIWKISVGGHRYNICCNLKGFSAPEILKIKDLLEKDENVFYVDTDVSKKVDLIVKLNFFNKIYSTYGVCANDTTRASKMFSENIDIVTDMFLKNKKYLNVSQISEIEAFLTSTYNNVSKISEQTLEICGNLVEIIAVVNKYQLIKLWSL